jgi:hypothetical protein
MNTTTTTATTTETKKSRYVSEWKRIGDKLVHKYSIAGAAVLVFTVYEPSSLCGMHSTKTSHEGAWVGELCTRELPIEIEAMKPFSDERYQWAQTWRLSLEAECYALIVLAFPEANGGTRRKGEIEIVQA